MAANTLTNQQRDKLLEMLATRETYADIAKAVGCSWANIDYYAKKYSEKIKTMREAHDARMIDRGLRSREKRIEKLENLANRIERDLEDKLDPETFSLVKSGLWFRDVKLSSTGMKVDVDVFAEGLIRQYRGLMDDIAKERGERTSKTEITGAGGAPVQIDIDDVTNLTAKQRSERLAALLDAARNRRNLPDTQS
jgi:IS30 family transposase